MRKLYVTAVSLTLLASVLACSRPVTTINAPPLVPSSTTALVTPSVLTVTPNAVVQNSTNTPDNSLSSNYEILRNRYYTFTHGPLIDEWQALGPNIQAQNGFVIWNSRNVVGLAQQIYLPEHSAPYACAISARYRAQRGGLLIQIVSNAGALVLNFNVPIKPLFQNYAVQFSIATHITAVRLILYAQAGELDEASLRCEGVVY